MPSSLDALGRRALAALAAGDTAAVRELRLTEREHRDEVWPRLPAARPEVGFPVDYAWSDIERRHARDLARMGPWFRARSVEHVAAECRGPVRDFVAFRVHADCWEVFRVPGGALLEAQIFEEVVEHGGRYRIFRVSAEEAPVPSTWGSR